tara:strand:+ start:22 stop:501 length:480 start_codon:yes stop_codon:yes gene_type:complete
MPKSCNSILNKTYYIFFICLISSCAILENINSSQFNGKVLVSQNNVELSTFNISVNILKNETIIQIKKPLYGNVLKIKAIQGQKTIMSPIKYNKILNFSDYLDKNIEYFVKECFYNNMLEIDQQIDNHNLMINCKKVGDKLNIFIKYEEYDLKGFILKI